MKTKELFELSELLERIAYMKEDNNQTYSQDLYSRDYLYGIFEAASLIRRYALDPNGSALGMMKKGVK